MATKFKVWIENPNASSSNANIESDESFAEDSSRINGWHAGETISSLKMNSVLRQASLITASLMEAFCPASTVGLTSSLTDVKTAMLAGIALKSDLTALNTTVSGLNTRLTTAENNINSMKTTLTNITSGGASVYNAQRLGGQPASYYQKKITSGTAAPSGGADGDIYIQYS